MNDSAWDMYVFRDGRKNLHSATLLENLQRRLVSLSGTSTEDEVLGALIAAGELECALTDAGVDCATLTKSVTDSLAVRLMRGRDIDVRDLATRIASVQAPETVSIAVAEGFAYYALHPFRFRDPVRELMTDAPVRIVGIRSIGTTLSAVVQALFEGASSSVERITVRPEGHPYDRKLVLKLDQQRWLNEAGARALVVIVDEGPGLSGSSFLSVAEAVEASGIDQDRIVLLGSRTPDSAQMRAPNAANRWSRFRFLAACQEPLIPERAQIDLGGGVWRRYFWQEFENQPASWAQLELAKYMSHDRESIFKFHGYGHFGGQIAERAWLAADAGFAPHCRGYERGFGTYQLLKGRLLTLDDRKSEAIGRAAEYCAFRRVAMQVSENCISDLESMAKWNWQCEFGNELENFALPVEHLVISDGRMLPHEWLRTDEGRVLKLDGSTHGDDHFFPGPCDIAWDLAGMIVEWQMDSTQAAAFLDQYRKKSGDNAQGRIADYILGYAIFRMGWSKMAARASAGSADEKLLMRDYFRYRDQALAAASRRTKRRESPGPNDVTTAIAA